MSSDVAIRIENLGKRYRYGRVAPLSSNLRADLTDWVRGMIPRRSQAKEKDPRAISDSNRSSTNTVGHETLSEVRERHIAESDEYFWALRDINLEIKKGEVIGVIGRNGAGKSTLLKILARITSPTAGRVTYRGRVASLLEVGTGFHRELTGSENIYLNGSILGMKRSEIKSKFDDIVAFAEIEKFIDTPVKFYSSGMYVRLAFAVAAHLEPDILLVDEVLAVGDMAFQAKCLGKMGEVAKTGITVVFVSHNMSAVENLCEKAALLVNGRLAQYDLTSNAVSGYVNQGRLEGEGNSDLSSHKGRHPQMKSVFKRLRFFNKDGLQCTSVPVGESLVVEVTLRADDSIRNVSLGIGIDTDFGMRILTFNSRFSGKSVDCPQGQEIVICCFVKEVSLLPGGYHVKLALDKPGAVYDLIDNAGVINVVDSNYYGGGVLPGRSQGIAVARITWDQKSPEQVSQ